MEKLLEISNLSLELRQDTGWKPILHQVNMDLYKGRTLGIVGESGSGKSVTALSVMRLLNPEIARYPEGQILFSKEGEKQPVDLLKAPEKQLQHIRGSRIAMISKNP